ncbi:hypothetical protein DXG01_010650 [Tephrocybe rancida]|nr:hypothetical protein DXG01_010650 [Tephrocybe rancida]
MFVGRLPVRPLKVAWPGERKVRVNCAVFLDSTNIILYGANDGIYISQGPEAPPTPALLLLDSVTQIDVLEEPRIVVFLSAQQLCTVPLDDLSHGNPKAIPLSSCTRLSSHVTFFTRGVIARKHLVCAVKSGPASTTVKLLEPVLNPKARAFNMDLYKDFYISEKVVSLHFLKTKLVAGTSGHDFEVIDIETLVTQPLLDPETVPPNRSAKCVAAVRTRQGVLPLQSSLTRKDGRQGA